MSNIVIYLPYEPLGKQGGMERATHGLAEMLRDAGHRVLLCSAVRKTGWGNVLCARSPRLPSFRPFPQRREGLPAETAEGGKDGRAY